MNGKNEKKKKIQLKRVYPFHIIFFKEPFIYCYGYRYNC